MKYIRTKEGIYEVERNLVNGVNLKCKPIESPLKIHIYIHEFVKNKEIINRADTIEELCDKWCYDNSSGEKNVIKDVDFMSVENIKKAFQAGIIVKNPHLAIWTEKGLIYVAKMNEKGELELL